MSFVAEFANIPRDKLLLDLYSCTAQDVERALVSPAGDLCSLLALLSPCGGTLYRNHGAALCGAYAAAIWRESGHVFTAIRLESVR